MEKHLLDSSSSSEDSISSKKKPRRQIRRIAKGSEIASPQKMTLEELPVQILDLIFQYVQTPDLLEICPLSTDLYWPAIRRIYHSITITGDDGFSWTCFHMQQWKVNYGTVMKNKNLESLIETIMQNKQLRGLVNKLVSDNLNEDDRWDAKSLIANLSNLTDWYDTSCDLDFDPHSPSLLKNVTCVIGKRFLLMNNIVELKVFCREEGSPDYYVDLADAIIQSNARETLRLLHFIHPTEPNFISRGELSCYAEENVAYWLCLFEALQEAGVKLKLKSLGINANLSGFVDCVLTMLTDTVELRGLKTLVLRHTERGDNEGPTLLERITQCTPLLSDLSVVFTHSDFERNKTAICDTLRKHIPGQLRNLYLLFSVPEEYAQQIRNDFQVAIVESQKSLVNFTYDDGFGLIPTRPNHPVVKRLMECMGYAKSDEVRRQQLFFGIADKFHSRPVLTRSHGGYISRNIRKIHDIIKDYFIFSEAARNSGHLKQVYLGDVHFNMRQFGVFVNDETILFETPPDEKTGSEI